MMVMLLLAAPLHAVELRDVNSPAKILDAFPAAAKIRVVNIWATWCVPCVGEMPDLRAVASELAPDVALVGVSTDDMIPEATRAKVVTFLDKQKIGYLNLYFKGNADDLTSYFHFEGEIPVTIAFDRHGKEVWRHQGAINRTETIAELRKLQIGRAHV